MAAGPHVKEPSFYKSSALPDTVAETHLPVSADAFIEKKLNVHVH